MHPKWPELGHGEDEGPRCCLGFQRNRAHRVAVLLVRVSVRPVAVSMDLQHLAPAMERLWIDEVQYLHHLWHLGPPPNPSPPTHPSLRPCDSTSFKRESQSRKRENRLRQKEERKKRRQERKLAQQQPQNARTPSERAVRAVPDVEWPVPPSPPRQSETGWGDLKSQPARVTRPATAEEQVKLAAEQLQRWALKSSRDFLKNGSSDGEGEDDDEDDDMVDDDDGESENFKFFLGLFTGNGELKSYYEKNWERGEFFCLVCGGIGAKIGKRFGNCVALVQHSAAIAKTKRRAAHRAFARAICRVLGWNVERLPSIVLDAGQPLSHPLEKSNSEEPVKEDGPIDQTECLPKRKTRQQAGKLEWRRPSERAWKLERERTWLGVQLGPAEELEQRQPSGQVKELEWRRPSGSRNEGDLLGGRDVGAEAAFQAGRGVRAEATFRVGRGAGRNVG
ncbi:hypothetical protein ACLOJK_010579 [Asimina triloba]